jgi:hypothetical protein
MKLLGELLEELPEELERQVFTHASWTERRDERAWLRWIGVLTDHRSDAIDRSASTRTEAGRHSLRSHPRFGQHATLPASLPSLPCALIGALW